MCFGRTFLRGVCVAELGAGIGRQEACCEDCAEEGDGCGNEAAGFKTGDEGGLSAFDQRVGGCVADLFSVAFDSSDGESDAVASSFVELRGCIGPGGLVSKC